MDLKETFLSLPDWGRYSLVGGASILGIMMLTKKSKSSKEFIGTPPLADTMQVDEHSFDRMTVRLTDDEKQKVLGAIETKWNRLENNMDRDFAIIALSLDSLRMTDNSGMDSNGEAVVGVVRKGVLKTIMLRRFNQPMTKDAIRVDAVKWAIPIPMAARKMMRQSKKWRK